MLSVFSFSTEKEIFHGTPAFQAPELFGSKEEVARGEYAMSPAIDVFALGATLYCMILGRPPWMAKNQIDLAGKISNFLLPLNCVLNIELCE